MMEFGAIFLLVGILMVAGGVWSFFNVEKVSNFQRRLYRPLYGWKLSELFFQPAFIYVGGVVWTLLGVLFAWTGIKQL
jgi:hypothetical protein